MFKAPVFVGASYGELTARSTGLGTLGYVNTLDDPEFGEVTEIVKAVLGEIGLAPNARKLGEVIQFAYQVACDPDADGSPFVIGGHPRCPSCDAPEFAHWAETDERVSTDVPRLTHRAWAASSSEERRAWVKDKVLELLSA